MRNLLALVAVVVLTLAGVGYYRSWYNVQSNPSDVHITINKDRVTEDVRKGEEKVHEALEKGQAPQTGKPVESTKSDSSKPAHD